MASDASFLEYGNVEPHAGLLKQPAAGRQLFKIMRAGDLVRSVKGNYLHFQRVDSYKDFPRADARDGEQLPQDRALNAGVRFSEAPDYSAADYYDSCRARTYACSFSLENSPHIWQHYGVGDPVGKVCVVFDFDKLRAALNATISNAPGRSALMVGNLQCKQIFQINYGLVEYADAAGARLSGERLPNPILYAYLKDAAFRSEEELRITLSTLGVGEFALADGSLITFPPSLQMAFDFRAAFASGAIAQLLCPDDAVRAHLTRELESCKVLVRPGTAGG